MFQYMQKVKWREKDGSTLTGRVWGPCTLRKGSWWHIHEYKPGQKLPELHLIEAHELRRA